MSRSCAVASPWQVTLFERWSLCRDEQRTQLPGRAQRLVAFLALLGEQPRSLVAGSLWPTSDETQARSSLRAAVVQVRRDAPDVLTVTNRSVSLDGSVLVDLQSLRNILDEALGECTTELVAAVSGWGELLPGWYEDWVLFERERWRHRRVMALHLMATRALASGDYGTALMAAEGCVGLEPLREASHRTVARAHLALGNRIEALRVYEEFRRRSILEFGLTPDERFERLVAPLLLERRQLTQPSVPKARRPMTP